MISVDLNYVLKVPSPNTVTLGAKSSTYEFWGDKIEFIAFIDYGNSFWFAPCVLIYK